MAGVEWTNVLLTNSKAVFLYLHLVVTSMEYYIGQLNKEQTSGK